MALFVYSLLISLAIPFVLLKLWWRGRSEPELWENWRERLGFVQPSDQPVIWVHAVSVGETIAAGPLVHKLRARHPDSSILVTAMTRTGADRARALFGESVSYAYVPYDYPRAIERFLERVRPRVLVVMETELWPNIIDRTRQAGIPVVVANARLSQRSAEGYRRVSWLARPLFRQLDWIAAQAESDAERFVMVGARPQAVSVTGSIKFDVQVTPELRERRELLRQELGVRRPIWIAASTHDGEDEQLLSAHRQLLGQQPGALLVLVPRHPERFRGVGRLVREQGFSLARRSRHEAGSGVQVYLGDTMGELMMLYGVADVAFIGGSLVTRGGHNPLEAAAWGIPVLSGPHVFNFTDIYERLAEGKGLLPVDGAEALADTLARLFSDRQEREQVGKNAEAVLEANQGALERLISGVEARLN